MTVLMSEDLSDEERQRSLKAALLLSRIVVANMVEEDFDPESQGIDSDETGSILVYEDLELKVVDLVGGALMLIRGLVLDMAQLEELHPAEIARVLELSCAMYDAIGDVGTY